MNDFKYYCKRVLSLHQINSEDTFGVEGKDEYYDVSYFWVIETFEQTSTQTQDIFKASLEKAILQGSSVKTFFQEMASMAIGH